MTASAQGLRAGDGSRAESGTSVRLQVLGPLRIWRDDVEVSAGPRQRGYLLALLLARAGRPASVTELIDVIWEDDAPATALNVIQKHVGALRRLLQPGLPARDEGSYVQRRGNGYMFVADSDVLDVLEFREHVKAAAAEQRPDAALNHYLDAVALWRGHAGDGFTHTAVSMPVFAALDDEFLRACTAAAELAVSLGVPGRMLSALRLGASMRLLNEPLHAALISVLAAAGQRAESLAVYEAIRTRLAEELGVMPGPELRAAHQRVISQTVAQVPAPRRPSAPAVAESTGTAEGMVGRVEELAVLRRAIDSALTGGSALTLVEGEPGIGKTRLLEQATAEARRRGVRVAWGHSLEGDGTPSMWPWMQVLRTILEVLPESAREVLVDGELGLLLRPSSLDTPVRPDGGVRFRLFERVVAVVEQVAAERPIMIAIDDLHWADVTSLQLFAHLAAWLPRGTVLVGTLRDRAPGPDWELTRTLAAVSRVSSHRRISLGPLDPTEVAELVRRETGQEPTSGVARSLQARTAGNPFFVRELTLLLAERGAITELAAERVGVPSSVRDVVRDRMSGLTDETRTLLEIAALVGRDVDLRLLAMAADLDTRLCLDRLESVRGLGLFEPQPGDPFTARFTHDLIRESVAETTPPRRAPLLHLRVADGLERTDPGSESLAERLAHHLWAAGPLADPARTATALIRAGRSATAKAALEAAERHLRSAVQIARAANLAELELSALTQLSAAHGMRSGYVTADLGMLERAEHLARSLGRETEAAGFLLTRWTAHLQALDLDHAGPLARRLRDLGETSSEPPVRMMGLFAWGIHQWQLGDAGAGYRALSRCHQALPSDRAGRTADPLRLTVQVPVWLAQVTAAHGDVDAARTLFDAVEADLGDDPYVVAVWSAFSALAATQVGDPAWALHAAERGIAADPASAFPTLRTHQRLARYWARAVTGDDPARAAAEAEEIITTMLLDPPLRTVASWYVALSEMKLAAGDLTGAAAALDRAEYFLDTYGQRDVEGLYLLGRARVLQARGEPDSVVRAALDRVRSLSTERETHLFAQRAANWSY